MAICDPHVKASEFALSSLTEVFKGADAIVLLTGHDEFNALIPQDVARAMRGRLVIDTRHQLDAEAWQAANFEMIVLGDGTAHH